MAAVSGFILPGGELRRFMLTEVAKGVICALLAEYCRVKAPTFMFTYYSRCNILEGLNLYSYLLPELSIIGEHITWSSFLVFFFLLR